MELRDAQRRVDEWIGQFEEGYWTPMENVVRLIEEVGELSREVNHRFGPKRRKAEEPEGDLELELGDILFVLICIANERGLDLERAMERVLRKYEVRDSDRWKRVESEDASSS